MPLRSTATRPDGEQDARDHHGAGKDPEHVAQGAEQLAEACGHEEPIEWAPAEARELSTPSGEAAPGRAMRLFYPFESLLPVAGSNSIPPLLLQAHLEVGHGEDCSCDRGWCRRRARDRRGVRPRRLRRRPAVARPRPAGHGRGDCADMAAARLPSPPTSPMPQRWRRPPSGSSGAGADRRVGQRRHGDRLRAGAQAHGAGGRARHGASPTSGRCTARCPP